MKKIFLLCFLTVGTAVAASGLTLADFQSNDLFIDVQVTQAEEAFYDELTDEYLFQVTYLVAEKCDNSGGVKVCQWKSVCEWIWVDKGIAGEEPYMEGTQKECSVDIEDILTPQIIDEL